MLPCFRLFSLTSQLFFCCFVSFTEEDSNWWCSHDKLHTPILTETVSDAMIVKK